MAGKDLGWWLSFADPDAPEGQRFRGAALLDQMVEGATIIEAAETAAERGCNPGGQVFGSPVNLAQVPPADRNRLLSKEEAVGLTSRVTPP